jgi:hypothetical protein
MPRAAKKPPVEIDPDEKLTTRELILKIIPDGAEWLKTPNSKFGGQKPEELLGTDVDHVLRNMAFNVKYGCFS